MSRCRSKPTPKHNSSTLLALATCTPPMLRVWLRRVRRLKIPAGHVILPEIISKEPLGPAVRHGDNEWGDIVRWSLNAMIAAEELDVTSANVEEKAASDIPEVQRLLGTAGELGAMLGLEAGGPKRSSRRLATMANRLPTQRRRGHPRSRLHVV